MLEVKKLEMPELTPELLDELGGFESTRPNCATRSATSLNRQLEYEQHRRAREQITAALTEAANWELPPGHVAAAEPPRVAAGGDGIAAAAASATRRSSAHENDLRQNSTASTARALKEHFILERIAEDEEIDASRRGLRGGNSR